MILHNKPLFDFYMKPLTKYNLKEVYKRYLTFLPLDREPNLNELISALNEALTLCDSKKECLS